GRGRRAWYAVGAVLLVAVVAAALVLGALRRHHPRPTLDRPLPSASPCVTPAVAGPTSVPTPLLPAPASSGGFPSAGPTGGVVAPASKAPSTGGIQIVTVAHTSFPYGGDSGRQT